MSSSEQDERPHLEISPKRPAEPDVKQARPLDGLKAREGERLPPDGSPSWYDRNGCAWKQADGAVVNVIKLDGTIPRRQDQPDWKSPTRQKLEKPLTRGRGHDIAGQQACHAIGPILGVESPHGMAMAPKDVNLRLQAHAIEQDIRAIARQRRPDVELYLRVETNYRPSEPGNSSGLCLREMNYSVYARQRTSSETNRALREGTAINSPELRYGQRQPIYCASLTSAGPHDRPQLNMHVHRDSARLESVLEPVPDRKYRRQDD